MSKAAQLSLILTLVATTTLGCASWGAERARVRSIAAGRVAAKELPCTVGELTLDVTKDEGSSREWIAGCNFKAILVTCSGEKCSQVIERTWREELYEEGNRL